MHLVSRDYVMLENQNAIHSAGPARRASAADRVHRSIPLKN